jgi:hypothetical protein
MRYFEVYVLIMHFFAVIIKMEIQKQLNRQVAIPKGRLCTERQEIIEKNIVSHLQ